jgi:hypothetical protein
VGRWWSNAGGEEGWWGIWGEMAARVSGIGTDADGTGRVGRSPPPGRNRNGGVAAAEHGGGGSRPSAEKVETQQA